MPYLNLDMDYFDHPKTKRLVGILGRGADILPVRLWCYCGKYHAESGDLTGYSPTDLETLIGWWGQPGRALDALLQPFQGRPGFLERTESGFKVHDWEGVNGHIAALKERAQAGAKARWEKYRDAKAMLEQSQSNAGSNAPTARSSPVHPNPPLAPRGGKSAEVSAEFEAARKAFPGVRRGAAVEYANFLKQAKKLRFSPAEVLPLLLPSVRRYKAHGEKKSRQENRPPFWQNFKTWINNQGWTAEYPGEAVTSDEGGKARAQAHYREHGFYPSGTPSDWYVS